MISNPFRRKPVPALATQAGADAAGELPPGRVGSVSDGAGEPSAADAVLAERRRVAAINAVASPEQAEMRDKFILDGTPALDAVLALSADSKTRPKAEAAPAVTAEAVAKEMLRLVNAASPPPTPTVSSGEQSALERYKAMKDPQAAAKFYAAHKAEIDELSMQSKKEV